MPGTGSRWPDERSLKCGFPIYNDLHRAIQVTLHDCRTCIVNATFLYISGGTGKAVNDNLAPLHSLKPTRFETPTILKKLAAASRSLAELKGVASTIPNQAILINTLGLQEAKDSSAIENIITTHDELYREDDPTPGQVGATAKEVLRYRQALKLGYEKVRTTGLITLNTVIDIQRELEANKAGLRKLPGTVLKDAAGRTVYTPPQDANDVKRLMGELEKCRSLEF